MLFQMTHFFRRFLGSLRFKLSFYAGVVLFIAVVVFALHSTFTQEKDLVNARVQGALKVSAVIKAAIWNGMMTKNREGIREIIKTIAEQEGFTEINIYDRTGVEHYTSGPSPTTNVNQVENPLLKDLATNASPRYRFLGDGRLLNVINPLINTRSCSSQACHTHPESLPVLGALEVTIPLENLRKEIVNSAHRTYFFAFCLFILISTIVGLGVIFLVSRPLRVLGEKAQKMASGEYEPDTSRNGYDSISKLYRSFDEMSRQINDRTSELQHSRQMYKELFDKVPCYLTVIDRNFAIVRANDAFRNEFGDQVGNHCFSAYKGLASKCENCKVEKTFADGVPRESQEIWNPRSRDSKKHVIVQVAPIVNDKGDVAEVMEMSVDVTRIMNLQSELAEKEEELRKLIENVPCYLTVIDRSFSIVFYNHRFAQDFGVPWGQKCFEIYKGRHVKCEDCPVEKTFSDGSDHSSEEVWNQDGKEIYIVTHTSPITHENGQVEAVMELCTNVTEVKLLQNQLATLGETIAGMSHTVKNIISGLEGGVYVVDSGFHSGNDGRVRQGWDMVKKNVDKISNMVKDILYVSKERQPEYRECDPGQILSDVYDLYLEKARSDGVQLIRDFPPSMAHGLLDANGIHSAVSNLVSNAIEACRGKMVRRVHHVTISGRVQGFKILIMVTDDGTGMPEEVKQSLFKKFYSTKGSKGTGLGLIVTRKVIEEHRGTLKVKSTPGEGTTFFLEIPLRTSSSETSGLGRNSDTENATTRGAET